MKNIPPEIIRLVTELTPLNDGYTLEGVRRDLREIRDFINRALDEGLTSYLKAHPSQLKKDIMEEKEGKVAKMKAEIYMFYYVRECDRRFIRTMQSMKREEVK